MNRDYDHFDPHDAADRIEIDQLQQATDMSWGWIFGMLFFIIGLILLIC